MVWHCPNWNWGTFQIPLHLVNSGNPMQFPSVGQSNIFFFFKDLCAGLQPQMYCYLHRWIDRALGFWCLFWRCMRLSEASDLSTRPICSNLLYHAWGEDIFIDQCMIARSLGTWDCFSTRWSKKSLSQRIFSTCYKSNILLMDKILHYLGWLKPYE